MPDVCPGPAVQKYRSKAGAHGLGLLALQLLPTGSPNASKTGDVSGNSSRQTHSRKRV